MKEVKLTIKVTDLTDNDSLVDAIDRLEGVLGCYLSDESDDTDDDSEGDFEALSVDSMIQYGSLDQSDYNTFFGDIE